MHGDLEVTAQRLYLKVRVPVTSPECTGHHAASAHVIPLCCLHSVAQATMTQPSQQQPAFQSNIFTWVYPCLLSHPNALSAPVHPNTNTPYSPLKV